MNKNGNRSTAHLSRFNGYLGGSLDDYPDDNALPPCLQNMIHDNYYGDNNERPVVVKSPPKKNTVFKR